MEIVSSTVYCFFLSAAASRFARSVAKSLAEAKFAASGLPLAAAGIRELSSSPWMILSTALASLAAGGCGRFGFGISRVGKSHLIFGRLKICSPGTRTEPRGGETHGG